MGHSDNTLAETGPESGGEPTPRLCRNEFYRALASERRRRLLYLLLDGDERAVGEFATMLTGWTATETGTMGMPAERDEIIVGLEHSHLPLLADAGLVTYDRQRGTVELESLAPAVETLIRQSIAAEQSTHE